jgi:hypothetical protein
MLFLIINKLSDLDQEDYYKKLPKHNLVIQLKDESCCFKKIIEKFI